MTKTRRYFTLAEANAQLPELTRRFITAMQLRGHLKTLYRRLDEAGFAPEGERFRVLVPEAPAGVNHDRATFKAMVQSLREQVAAVHACGCAIKDLETGLVDWWSHGADGDVLLCWRLGEPEVAHWHHAQAGVAGRRPLSELRAAIPTAADAVAAAKPAHP